MPHLIEITKLVIFVLKLVDCEWDEWQIGECSEECGGGIRINTRSPKVESAHGGEGCAGSSSITESCNVQECPGICLLITKSLKGSFHHLKLD